MLRVAGSAESNRTWWVLSSGSSPTRTLGRPTLAQPDASIEAARTTTTAHLSRRSITRSMPRLRPPEHAPRPLAGRGDRGGGPFAARVGKSSSTPARSSGLRGHRWVIGPMPGVGRNVLDVVRVAGIQGAQIQRVVSRIGAVRDDDRLQLLEEWPARGESERDLFPGLVVPANVVHVLLHALAERADERVRVGQPAGFD